MNKSEFPAALPVQPEDRPTEPELVVVPANHCVGPFCTNNGSTCICECEGCYEVNSTVIDYPDNYDIDF